MNGWIKFYRKLWTSNSPLFEGRNRANKIVVWLWMLSHANEEGITKFGRNQVAKDTGLSPDKVYRIVKFWSLKAHKETHIKPHKEFTEILILNWHEYQDKPHNKPHSKPTGNRTSTAQQPHTNKNKNIEDKEYISKDILESLQENFPTKSVFQEYESAKDWKANHPQRKIVDWTAFMRNWLRRSPDTRTPPIKPMSQTIDNETLDLINRGKLIMKGGA